jgi:hypothetical protein
MSIGGDEYGAGEEARSGTRTRLPGEDGDVYGASRTPSRPGRSLLMVVGVVVLLVAAIAFANRGGGSDGGQAAGTGGADGAAPTAPTGRKPVHSSHAATGIPSGFPHTKQGAQSAAANYAVALGGDGMFNPQRRHAIVQAVSAPSARKKLQSGFDADYSTGLNKKIGLNAAGKAPAGATFVNRTIPVGTDTAAYDSGNATVDVWCTSLFGIAGKQSTKPVTSNWFTVTFHLAWAGSDWKITSTSQKSGPTPVGGDNPVSNADEIGGAVKKYGGFTYAR